MSASRHRAAAILALVAAALLPALPGVADPAPPGGLPTAQIAADAGWSWFSEPRAVRQDGTRDRTYLGWIDSEGDLVAGAYDHASRTVETSVLMTSLPVDDHNNPSVLVRPDGRITMFWSAHNGGALYHRTTSRPEDIAAWGPIRKLPVNVPGDRAYTYSNPIVLSAERNRLYLFWRAGYTHPAFATSPDMGARWTSARPLIEVPEQRPYVKYATNGRDTIAMAFTNGHPAETHSAIYYSAYRAGQLRRADGRPIAPLAAAPITPGEADLVYRPGPGEDAWVHDVALDPATGHPRIVFATIPGPDGHHYWYAAWDGSRWRTAPITSAGGTINDDEAHWEYTAGASLDHDSPGTVYLSRPGFAKYEIEEWTTADLGATWNAASVTQGSTQDNVRPVAPRNSRGGSGPKAIWMSGHYGYFTTFQTSAGSDSTAFPWLAQPTGFREVGSKPVDAAPGHVQLSGRLTAAGTLQAVADREISLQVLSPDGSRWHTRAYAKSDGAGKVVFIDRPRRATSYRLYWPGDEQWQRNHGPVLDVMPA